MRFSAKVTEKATDPSDSSVICDLEGVNQDNRQILGALHPDTIKGLFAAAFRLKLLLD